MEKTNETQTAPKEQVVGDCDYCGHSIIYHVPLFGCSQWGCGCDEFH